MKTKVVFYAVICDDKVIERFPITTDSLELLTIKNNKL